MVCAVWEATVAKDQGDGATAGEKRPPPMFGRYVAWVRTTKNISQEEVGRIVGIPQSEVSKWETGKLKNPPPDKVRLWARAIREPLANVALAYAGVWPGKESLPAVVQDERGEVVPEFVALLNLRLSPQEAALLGDIARAQRRYLAEALGDPPEAGDRECDAAPPGAR